MRSTLMSTILCIICSGTALSISENQKRGNPLEAIKLIKDITKSKLLDHLTKDTQNFKGYDEVDDQEEEDSDDVDLEAGNDIDEEDEFYSDEYPVARYNAGKMSQLKSSHEDFGISGFNSLNVNGSASREKYNEPYDERDDTASQGEK